LAEAFFDPETGNLVGRAEPWNDREEAFGGGLTNDNTQTVPLPERFENEGEFVDAISAAFISYNNDVNYSPFPGSNGQRFDRGAGGRFTNNTPREYFVGNSNSLAGSVLRAAGSDFKPVGVRLPGWDNNIRTIRRSNR